VVSVALPKIGFILNVGEQCAHPHQQRLDVLRYVEHLGGGFDTAE
jgi:hypothetical protein